MMKKINIKILGKKGLKKPKQIPSFQENKNQDSFSVKKKRKKKTNWFLTIIGALFFMAFFGVVLGIFSFFYITKDLPRPKDFADTEFNQSTKIFDRNGEVLLSSVYGEEKRTYVELSKIPEIMQKAIIATEDSRFYTHVGFDVMGIMRAIKVDIETGAKTQGASTITQQLIRATFLTSEKTVTRKIKEILLATELERKYSKDQILEWYLNKVPFGINIYGIEEASLTYFEKPAQELNLAESALLAAIVQAPSYYSPYGPNLEKLISRKNNVVLRRMIDEGYINEEEKKEAEEYEFKFAKIQKNQAHHFVEYVKSILRNEYGPDALETQGLKIYTTLDWELQKEAEKIVKEGVEKNRKTYGAYNGAMVIMSPKNGEILAMIGSADPWAESAPEGCTPGKNCKFEPWMNIPVSAKRQPGSSFKPIVYASAFEKGATDMTIVVDEPINYGGYSPNNFDMLFRGPITMRNSLAQSLNIPAVKTLRDHAGLESTVDLARKMGISLPYDASFYGLPFALGAADVTMLEMASAFSVFANGGFAAPHSAIIKIVDAKGEVIYENNTNTPRVVLSENTCKMITSILSDNRARTPVFGANSNLKFDNYQVSVKTGTTQNSVDGWTIGYTSDAVVVVWSGNNDRTPIKGTVGEMTAAPMWRKAIEKTIQLYKTKPINANPWYGIDEEEKSEKIKEIIELLREKMIEEEQLQNNIIELPNIEMNPTP